MKSLDWFFAARPMLHLPVWSVYLVSLHYHNQLSGEQFDRLDLLTLSALFLIVAGAYYINQVFDEESDRINGKLLFLQQGILTSHQLMFGYILISLIGVALGWFVTKLAFYICLQLFLMGYLYSAPPFRWKDRPILGLLTNAWSFGFLISIVAMPDLTFHNAGLLGWDNPFYFAGAIGGIHCLTTIPDIKGDREAGKKTIAVAIGHRGAALVGALCLAFAAYVGYRSNFPVLTGLAIGSAALSLAAAISTNSVLLKLSIMIPILALTILAGFYYPLYLLFIVVLIAVTRIYYRRRFSIAYPSLTR